jgi:CRP/FNR family transcriptional regulator, dissimilatory nitrate respiration regulator
MPGESEGFAISTAFQEQLLLLSKNLYKVKGTILFRRGDACAGLYLIRKGKVRLTLDTPAPLFQPRILGPGCVVGLPSAVAGSAYSLTGEVMQDVDLAWVTREALTDCLRENPPLCFEVMDMLSREISETRSAIKHSSALRPRSA